MKSKKEPFLNRYTSLPVTVDILVQKRITLLNPDMWEDRNDAFNLAQYREKKKLQTLLVICFSTSSPIYYHWKIFSGTSSGVCIQFNKDRLLEAFNNLEGFRYKDMEYRSVKELQTPSVEELPFLKLKAFRHDKEFRIIYENKTEIEQFKHVDIPLGIIKKITLSPWLSEKLVDSIRKMIRKIDECEHLTIKHSKITDNPGWKKVIEL